MADNPQTEIEISDNVVPTLSTSALQSALNTQVGIVTETAPASDTASSGLNGRLQRIAQRLTSVFTALIDGTQQSKIRGATDGTLIGNVSDALKVAIASTAIAPSKTFSITATGVTIGNGKSMISLVNTSGSTVKIKIREIWITNTQLSGVTGIVADFQLNQIVGHSGGSLLTSRSHDSVDTIDASVTARAGATVSGEGANYKHWLWSTDEWGPGPADTEAADHSFSSLVPHYRDPGLWKAYVLNANEGIHIKQITNSIVGTFDFYMVFTQE